MRVEEGTIWLSQKSLAELFQTTARNIGMHIQNVFSEEELDELSTTKDFFLVQLEGAREVNRKVKHYNLDAIIAVGYRVNSKRATAFRQWATGVLRDDEKNEKKEIRDCINVLVVIDLECGNTLEL